MVPEMQVTHDRLKGPGLEPCGMRKSLACSGAMSCSNASDSARKSFACCMMTPEIGYVGPATLPLVALGPLQST